MLPQLILLIVGTLWASQKKSEPRCLRLQGFIGGVEFIDSRASLAYGDSLFLFEQEDRDIVGVKIYVEKRLVATGSYFSADFTQSQVIRYPHPEFADELIDTTIFEAFFRKHGNWRDLSGRRNLFFWKGKRLDERDRMIQINPTNPDILLKYLPDSVQQYAFQSNIRFSRSIDTLWNEVHLSYPERESGFLSYTKQKIRRPIRIIDRQGNYKDSTYEVFVYKRFGTWTTKGGKSTYSIDYSLD